VVRLILGREEPGDHARRNKYTRAADLLREWERTRAIVPTPGPAWFPYEMRFSYGATPRRVRGIICQVEIEPLGGSIRPHERTLPGPIEDRLRLLRAVSANLSPVYALFDGPQPEVAALLESIAATQPERRVLDDQGVEHRMWVLDADDPGAAQVSDLLGAEPLLIADGNHRYSVAQVYREEMRERVGPGPWDHLMMLLVDAELEDPPVLPIHRVVLAGETPTHGSRVRDLAEILATLDDTRLVYGSADRENGRVIHRVASLVGQPPTVFALHEQVLGHASLGFVPDAAAAESAVKEGRARAAYFLPPTRVDRIKTVLDRNERLPQKSTYFWPKPRTGMVIRPFR